MKFLKKIMSKKLILLAFLVSLLGNSIAFASTQSAVSNPSYLRKDGTSLRTVPDGLNLGTVANPLGDIFAGNLTVSGITLSGDLAMGGFDITDLGQIFGAAGTATDPTYSITGETNTGFWGDGVGSAYIGTGGIARVTVNSGGIVSSAKIRTPDGSVTAPAYTFSNDIDTGLYRIGANEMGLTAGGVNQMTVADSGVTIHGNGFIGAIELVEDAGATIARNIPVSSTPAAGTEQSLTWQIDQTDHLIAYAEADSSGGIQNSSVKVEVRLEENQGADIASANDITLGSDGNFFDITGTIQINRIATAGWRAGARFSLGFDGALTVKDAQAPGGGFGSILMTSSSDYLTSAGSIADCLYDGTDFKCWPVFAE